MLGISLTTLIAAMMASEGPSHLDAQDHRRLHEALIRLGQDLPADESLPSLEGRPDPEVGRRVPGVTKALWDMNLLGALFVNESGRNGEYRADPGRIKELGSAVEDLPAGVREHIYRRAADWSNAVATDLKNDLRTV